MKKYVPKILLLLAFVGAVILLDRVTKTWAVNTLKGQPDIVLIPGVLVLRYLENTGMAFGLLKNQQILFYIMTFLVLIPVLFILIRFPLEKRTFPMFLALCLLTGGAIGNLIDRLAEQYVVDFIYFSLINFPIFNVADICVTISCILLFILILFVYKEEEMKRMLNPFRKAS